MADQDELRLRIVPELDPEATKQVEDDLNKISGNIPIGGKGKGAEAKESDALNQSIRTRIDLIDLESRKTQAQSLDRVKALQTQAAQGRMTQGELIAGIEREEAVRSRATQLAIRDYDAVQRQIAETTILTEKQSIALERKLLFATERAKTGLVSASRSMEGLASNTKSANIAFANFGRIVQDAPFGLLGISNNIDPLLNSFRDVKQEAGGAGAALKQIGSQLLGPAGLIFLLGSALPTALLFAQKYLGDTEKEANQTTEAIKALNEELIKSFSTAAAEKGIDQVKFELAATEDLVRTQQERLDKINEDASFAYSRQKRNERAELIKNIAQNNQLADSYKTQIAIIEQRTKNEQLYANTVIGSAKREKDAAKEKEEADKKARQSARELNDEIERRLALLDEEFFRLRRGRPTQEFEVSELRKRVQESANVLREGNRLLTREEIDEARNRAIQVSDSTLEVTRAGLATKLQLYRTSEQQVGEVMSAGAKFRAQILENEEQGLIEMMDLSTSIARNAFGNNKAVAVAEALVNTYVGVSRAFKAYDFPLSGVIAGLQLANGLAVVDKIRRTKIGDTGSRGGSATQSASVSAPSLPFVNDLGLAGQVAGTITPFGASMSPSINITANLDRQGLALAVRDGEADIATRQIPFAS